MPGLEMVVLLSWESLTTSLREIRDNLRVVVPTSTVLRAQSLANDVEAIDETAAE